MADSEAPASVVGKIKSVYCNNFVTFSEIIFHPDEYLNIVIAPNGSGKSTIVAAIVLCLGGEPAVLSRANKIDAYIKNGETHAVISVDIYSDNVGGTQRFKRSFNRLGKSEFRIDGRVSTKSKLLETVAKYSIQVANLCQFLPQDRVQDFAKMDPKELLKNTISSVCNPDVIETFERLKGLRKSQLENEKLVAVNGIKLQAACQHVEQLKGKVEDYQARRTLSSKVDVAAAKRLWLEADQLHSRVMECQPDVEQAKKIFQKHEKNYTIAKQKEDKINQLKEKMYAEMRKANVNKRDALNKITDERTYLNNVSTNYEETKSELIRKKQTVREQQTALSNELELLEVRLGDFSAAKKRMRSEEQRRVQQNELEDSLRTLNERIMNLNQKHSSIRNRLDREYTPEIQLLRSRIEDNKNKSNKKLKFLRDQHPHVYQAVAWLHKNRDKFTGRIYNPILLEIEVDAPYAIYVENAVSTRDLLVFICEDKSDMSRLITELCTNQKLKINVAHSAPASRCEYTADLPIASLRSYGFSAYLKDLVRGPPTILNYLCSLFNLHNIPIGDNSVNNNTDEIPRSIRNYFGGDKRFNLIISKYSGEGSLATIYVQSKNLLAVGRDNTEELVQKLRGLVSGSDSLKNERTEIEGQIAELEAQRCEVKAKKAELVKEFQNIQIMKGQLKRQKDKCESLKAGIVSIPQIEAQLKNETLLYVQNSMQCIRKLVASSEEVRVATAAVEYCHKKISIYESSNAVIINAVHEATEHLTNAKTLYRQVEEHLEHLKKSHQAKMNEALRTTNNCKPTNKNFPNKQVYRELPNTIEELDNAIDDYTARLDCMATENKDILEEFRKKQLEVQDLEAAIETGNKTQTETVVEINTLYSSWTSAIIPVIESLNKHFSTFMRKLDYAGEVQLSKEHDHDFDSYGIRIMVTFRENVALEPLTRTRQSGGERAVSIAMYTLSMQHLTRVPFRCVDEINQGMDPTNEKKVFDMLVDETTKTGSAQYFYVTPKLAQDVSEHPRLSVHVVYNGENFGLSF